MSKQSLLHFLSPQQQNLTAKQFSVSYVFKDRYRTASFCWERSTIEYRQMRENMQKAYVRRRYRRRCRLFLKGKHGSKGGVAYMIDSGHLLLPLSSCLFSFFSPSIFFFPVITFLIRFRSSSFFIIPPSKLLAFLLET